MKMRSLLFVAAFLLCCSTSIADETHYVDLGLPSGTLWADQNEPGVYTFNETVDKFSGREMPGMHHFQELVDNCTWKWNGSGYTIIGVNGDSITLPAAAFKDCQGNWEEKPTGYYWSAEMYDKLEAWGLYFTKEKVWTTMSFIKCMALPVRKIKYPKRDFQIPDYESIQTIGKESYEALLQRFRVADSTLSVQDIQAVYYGSAFYGYLAGALNMTELNGIYYKKGHQGLASYLDNYLSSAPVDINAILFRMSAAHETNDTITFNRYIWMYHQLCQALFATGDGDSKETAIHVVNVADEYALMNYVMDLQVGMQTLLTSGHDMFDVITKNGRKTYVYFDIQLVLALERQMFSKDKSSFHFTYNKDMKYHH